MQFDIDHQDLVNLARDTRKGFDRARYGLMFSLGALAAVATGAAYQTYSAGAVILAAAPEVSPSGLADAYYYTPGVIYAGLVWAGLIVLCAILAMVIVKARRKRETIRKQEILEDKLAYGRFDYTLALDKVIVRGPASARKISWSNIERIEKKKSSIMFRRKDGMLEFIPRNVWPKKDFYEQVMAKHGAAINKPCPFEEANHAHPLSITYESVRSDADEYFAHYFHRRDGRLNVLRRVGQWRPWAPILFTIFTALFVLCAIAAFRAEDLVFAAMSLGFAGAATTVFILNSDYFRGAAFPLRKDKSWPFAQTDLVTVTLSKNGAHRTRHGMSELIQWPAIDGFLETRLFGYLIVSARTVIPLPKRAFLSKSHYEKFAAFARRAISEAKHARREKKRGRLMRSLGKEEAAAKAQKTPAQAAPAASAGPEEAAAGRASARKATPQQSVKPKVQQAPNPSAKTPLDKPVAGKKAPQQSAPQKPASAKSALPKKAPSKAPSAPPKQKQPADPQQAVRQAAQKKYAAQ